MEDALQKLLAEQAARRKELVQAALTQIADGQFSLSRAISILDYLDTINKVGGDNE